MKLFDDGKLAIGSRTNGSVEIVVSTTGICYVTLYITIGFLSFYMYMYIYSIYLRIFLKFDLFDICLLSLGRYWRVLTFRETYMKFSIVKQFYS